MPVQPPFTALVQSLPTVVPFVAPEALERRRERKLILRLGANESPFGISPRAREAMESALEHAAWYGDPESYELRAELARRLGVVMSNLVVGSGIDDLLGLIVRALVAPGERVVTSLGAYPTFNYHVAGYGGELHRVPYRDDRNDLKALAAAARAGARLVYLANPDNPSGSWYPAADLAALIAALPPDCLLVLDEAYLEFAPAAEVLPIMAEDPRVIRLRTFSKAHGMAGTRIGYAIAAAEMIAGFDKIRLHFGVNAIAQAGALASLSDVDFVAGVVRAVAEGRRDYEALARSLALTALPSATNFVAIDVGGVERARALVELLLARDVFVRMPGAAPLDRCIRITVGTPDERTAFAEVMRELHAAGELQRIGMARRVEG